MTILPASLRARLARRKLMPAWASPDAGPGERRSRMTGAGLEFEDHRPYQPGDDLRHLDRHALARFRAPYVKRFAAERGLAVTVLLDESASMTVDPVKARAARIVASGVAYLALAAGDRLRVARFAGPDEVRWYPAVRGLQRFADVDAWLEASGGTGVTDLEAVARRCGDRLGNGLVVVVSDWWTDDVGAAVRAFARGGAELLAVHVTSRAEREPSDWLDGEARLVDAETGEAIDATWTEDAIARYLETLDQHRAALSEAARAVRARYLPVHGEDDIATVLLRDWRRAGVVA